MERIFYKKFSVGLSLDITLDEYKNIIAEYGNYIYSIYFSPPLGDKFHSRKYIAMQLRECENVRKLEEVIELFASNGIIVDADLNVSGLSDDDVDRFIKYINERSFITEVTTLDQYANKIHHSVDVNMVYSFNNFYDGEKIKNYYDTIVVGKRYLRDVKAINNLVSSGKNAKILINNGCSFDCATCLKGPDVCEQIVVNHLNMRDINQLYAEQTIFPWELQELIKLYDGYEKIYFKISNRTSGYHYLIDCLDAYLLKKDVETYVKENIEYYSLFCRMGSMRKRFSEMSFEKIEQEKRKLAFGN